MTYLGELTMRRISWPAVILILLLSAACSPIQMADRKLPPPFRSTPEEQKNVDRLLARWEAWNAGVKTFDCGFKRWVYDGVFGPPDQPAHVDLGTIKYAAPDHAMFRVDKTEKNGEVAPIEDARAEHWTFDGTSLFEVNHAKSRIVERKLPAGVQGTKLVDGPLTFAFGVGGLCSVFGTPPCPYPFTAKAKELKEQFYLRETTPPANRNDQVWLEAYPRSGRVAFAPSKLELIFRASDMSPVAVKIVQPNDKNYVVYSFFDVAVNGPPASSGDNPFHPAVPVGWQKKIAE
jgi:TIGR03009 family protein